MTAFFRPLKSGIRTALFLAVVLSTPRAVAASEETEPAGAPAIEVELIDSVSSWCSPLWGHNAPKVVAGIHREVYVALYSGEYPEASVQILKRSADGNWERGTTLQGAYQPSLLFVDSGGRLNIIQNSQSGPMLHLRSADSTNLRAFDLVARGNGQPDGKGWYVGAGIQNDTVYLSYVTLAYDLFLTWKPVKSQAWAPPVLLHAGLVDAINGNHAWTRPRFQFHGGRGYLVVNETSDGSVKNTYNAVHLVTFDLSDPRRFSSECIDRVAQGFGSYSSDFLCTADGWFHCLVGRAGRLYDTPSTGDTDAGVYVASRHTTGISWGFTKVFEGRSDGSLVVEKTGLVTALRFSPAPDRAGAAWEACRSDDHGKSWLRVELARNPARFLKPSHGQVLTGASGGAVEAPAGVFEDDLGKLPSGKGSRFGVYYFHVVPTESNTKGQAHP
jgi:hypothetical protein